MLLKRKKEVKKCNMVYFDMILVTRILFSSCYAKIINNTIFEDLYIHNNILVYCNFLFISIITNDILLNRYNNVYNIHLKICQSINNFNLTNKI